ncbi:hypothetical protein QVD17_02038 [Tagetes erecta]|uniref:Uncharacterized protein n=1 Tax=Tagetes erecta TaxID=13708 RepID=A0AAD8L5V6_TARER|nr:hypothetical protein QVD17_02038 [Tagetes erecta]
MGTGLKRNIFVFQRNTHLAHIIGTKLLTITYTYIARSNSISFSSSKKEQADIARQVTLTANHARTED